MPETPACGRTGVTTEISSLTASNTTITVGRIRIASGTFSASGLGVRQALHQPHHVVAEIAEQARRHRRQIVGRAMRSPRSARAGSRGERLVALGSKARGSSAWRSISATPSWQRQTRSGSSPIIEIAAAHRAAFDGFEQEGRRRAPVPQLEEAATGVTRSPTSVVAGRPASPAS